MIKHNNLTLGDLVEAVDGFAKSHHEVGIIVSDLINSGKVKLRGQYKGAKITLPGTSARPTGEFGTRPRARLAGSSYSNF